MVFPEGFPLSQILPIEFIMLPNEKFALDCLQRYAENGDIVDSTNGQFAHCPQPERYGDKGYYLTWEDHQHQGLLQSRDVGEKCFFNADVKKWLLGANVFPDRMFDLWDIYDYFTREHASVMHTEEANSNRRLANSGGKGRSSREVIAKQSKSLKKTISKLTLGQRQATFGKSCKPVQIQFPNGMVGVYPSATFAAMAVGVHKLTMQKWSHFNKKPSRGKFVGYAFSYKNNETL